jgi:hypothetical protein
MGAVNEKDIWFANTSQVPKVTKTSKDGLVDKPEIVAAAKLVYTIPPLPWDLPLAPTGLDVYQMVEVNPADSSSTVRSNVLNWVNNPTDDAPYEYGVTVERMAYAPRGSGQWVTIATGITGGSYTDSTVAADNKYQYRIKAVNSTGSSSYVTSDTLITTPAAPTGGMATRLAADIQISWTDASSVESGFQVWHAANGIRDTSPLATVGAGVKTYVHTGASATATHTYWIRAVAGVLESAYATTATVPVVAPPQAPTALSPGGTVFDRAAAKTFSWQHNSADTTAQSAWQLRYRVKGNAEWMSLVDTGSTAQTAMLANTFASGANYEWQVCTKGYHANYSPWSATATFTARNRPVATIITPSTSLGVDRVTLSWSYYSDSGRAQAAYSARLVSPSGNVLRIVQASSTATTVAFPDLLDDGRTYSVSVTVTDQDGQTSNQVSAVFAVDYAQPPAPAVDLQWQPDDGSVLVTMVNPPSGPGVPDSMRNAVYRIEGGQEILVVDDVPLTTTIKDRIPPLGMEVAYKIVTFSDIDTTTTVTGTVLTAPTGDWFYFNTGPGWSIMARARFNVTLSRNYARQKSLHHFAGRRKPVQFLSQNRDHSKVFTAILDNYDETSCPDAFTAVEDDGDIVCYREPLGLKMFVSLGELDFPEYPLGNIDYTGLSVPVTEVDYAQ